MIATLRQARRVVLHRLKNDPALTAIVPADRWYPQTTPPDPVWPFGKLGAANGQQFHAAAVEGGVASFSLHVFARDREEAGVIVETGEDYALRVGEHVTRVLADGRYDIVDGTNLRIHLSDFQLLPDLSPDAFHWHCRVNVRHLAEAMIF